MVDADLGGGGEFPGGSWQALDPDNLTNGCGGNPDCSSSRSTQIDISDTYSDTWPPQLTPRSNAPVTNPLDDEGPQFSRDYSMIPFVPGSGLNGVGNWLHDNLVESGQWLHDEMEKCVMCGPSLGQVLATIATPRYSRVGRWMSPEELSQMKESGRVVESDLNGVTSVTYPPNPGAWTPPSGRVFATFDVPASSVRFPMSNGWAKILGPHSFAAELYEITEMPEALNIEVLP